MTASGEYEMLAFKTNEADAPPRRDRTRGKQLRLPNAHLTWIDQEKISDYLLSSTNPRGKAKADFFLSFGFSLARWEQLAEALRRHATSHAVARVVETAYGPRYHVDGEIETPDGRNPLVRTVWQIDLGAIIPGSLRRTHTGAEKCSRNMSRSF